MYKEKETSNTENNENQSFEIILCKGNEIKAEE
jgi:hypothetical protein